MPTPVPSPLISLLPSPTAIPTPVPTNPIDRAIPLGFRPLSVTFVSADEGWVLGSAPCSTGRCPVIAHTLDGGRKWATIPAPQTAIGTTGQYNSNAKGVAGLRFADARDGWAFGPELWATHDGGATWKRLDPFPGGAVLALESARGTVHAVLYDTLGSTDFRIASAPVGGDDWKVSTLQVPVGGGPVPVIQLVLSGDAGWVVENDRVVIAGARLVAGTWKTWQPPCVDGSGPVFIGASTASDLLAACDLGLWGKSVLIDGAFGAYVFTSRDGGVTFPASVARNPLIDSASVLATPERSTIVVGGAEGNKTVLIASFDGGKTWAPVHDAGSVGLTELGFTTTEQGVVIATASSGVSNLLMTRDGGHTWSRLAFATSP